jgi:hypothetical protein
MWQCPLTFFSISLAVYTSSCPAEPQGLFTAFELGLTFFHFDSELVLTYSLSIFKCFYKEHFILMIHQGSKDIK